MPIRKVSGGYKWGKSGKVYPTKAGAQKQAQAAYASGYNGYKNGGPVAGQRGRMSGLGSFISGAANMLPGYPINIGNTTVKVGGIPGQAIHGLMNAPGNTAQTYIEQGMSPQDAGTHAANVAAKFRAAGTGPSAAMALQRMQSGVGRFPGGKGGGKGAGGGYGQMQRMRRKEDKQTNRIAKQIASLIDPQTFIDQGMSEADAIKVAGENKAKYGTPEEFRKYRFEKNFGRASVYGTGKELRAGGIDALPSLATSWGQYKNWDEEIWPWLQANNMDYANAPDPRIPQEEIDKFKQENPLGIRTLPPWWGG